MSLNKIPIVYILNDFQKAASIDDDNCASKYLLYRSLARTVPPHIDDLISYYDEEYLARESTIEHREYVLELKEDIDDYLEEVMYRVLDRLDSVKEVSRLRVYSELKVEPLTDKMNSIKVSTRIQEIIISHTIRYTKIKHRL